jgi:ParB family chromosome partitioning protein
MQQKRPALGKGLSALIPDAPEPLRDSTTDVDIDRLTPNNLQPRVIVDDARLHELSRSIKANGVIQPIIVRRQGDHFQIIAGERRWRAAKLAGLQRVPINIKEVAPGQERSLLEIALVENLQREDLNPIDEALAYRRLADEFGLTQDAIATAVGKDRATVTNTLRLLKLPQEVQAEVTSGRLSMGHARALIALTRPGPFGGGAAPVLDADRSRHGTDNEADQLRIARDVIARGLSVRETEALVKRLVDGPPPATEASKPKPVDVHTRAAEDRLKLLLGTRVRIVRRGARGRIEIDFVSEDELIRIYERITELR